MKKLAIAFLIVGILVIAVSAFGGRARPSQAYEFGAAQLLGVEIGIGLALAGIGIASTKLGSPVLARDKIREASNKIWQLPATFWIFFAFFITYIAFFLIPVFLNSKLEIRYVTDYIRDQGRIGFDIRAIMERIGNWFITGQSPYADGFIAYPPLTIALLAPLILIGFPAYYYLMAIVTVTCFIISVLLIPWLKTERGSNYLIPLFFFSGLFSYGFQFELERGQFNLIAFTFCMVAICLFHWRSEFNYWAYLLFAISTQLKVYPIFFIIMFVRDWRDWKNNIRRFAGLAALNFSILFVMGNQMFRDFLRTIAAYQFNYDSNRHENLSIKGFVHSLGAGDIPYISEDFALRIAQNSTLLELVFFTLLGISALLIIRHAYVNRTTGFNPFLLAWCVICALVVPSVSNDYKLSILIAPATIIAISFAAAKDRKSKTSLNLVIFIYFLAYWSTLYPFILKPDTLSRNFPALLIMLLTLPWLSYLSTERNARSTLP